MNSKKFNIIVIVAVAVGLVIAALPTIIIDPCFHYHAPLADLEYPLDDERYQNNGIVRNFEYDAIITGTSMTENFKVTEFDELFDTTAVKVPYSGGKYNEVDQNLKTALKTHPETKIVLRSVDYSMLVMDKDMPYFGIVEYGYQYPFYMIDENLFSDVSYFWNKSILFGKDLAVIQYTNAGNTTTSFDEYMNWNSEYCFSKETVINRYVRPEASETVALSEEEAEMVRENVVQNIVETANQYPDTTFYLFFPPYSICYWDSVQREGKLDYMIDAEQIAIEELLKCDNVRLFSFTDNYDLICDMDQYKDEAHYGEWINSDILHWIVNGEHELTEENYQDYLAANREFYSNYDYDSVFGEKTVDLQ